ncbi:MAG: ribosomal protein S18-alanine N-acetyltransferase [Anaerolineales bacterium]|nr:ribosomal protein S18-alanine N-acetyltransferase [Anaerolineales bacterium]
MQSSSTPQTGGPSAHPITIRRMKLADIDEVKQIDDLSFTLSWPRKAFMYELEKNPTSRFYVAEVPEHDGAERVVGMLGLWLIIDEIHISTLAVHPDYRRQGAAYALIARALLEGLAKGATSASLEVRESNLAAQELYKKFGFKITGRRPRYYKDNNEDAVLMTILNLDTIRKVI